MAFAAGQTPSAVTDAHFERLSNYYTAREMTEIMAVISMFGFLNRWNDTMASPLEPDPIGVAERLLAPHGWEIGRNKP